MCTGSLSQQSRNYTIVLLEPGVQLLRDLSHLTVVRQTTAYIGGYLVGWVQCTTCTLGIHHFSRRTFV